MKLLILISLLALTKGQSIYCMTAVESQKVIVNFRVLEINENWNLKHFSGCYGIPGNCFEFSNCSLVGAWARSSSGDFAFEIWSNRENVIDRQHYIAIGKYNIMICTLNCTMFVHCTGLLCCFVSYQNHDQN